MDNHTPVEWLRHVARRIVLSEYHERSDWLEVIGPFCAGLIVSGTMTQNDIGKHISDIIEEFIAAGSIEPRDASGFSHTVAHRTNRVVTALRQSMEESQGQR